MRRLGRLARSAFLVSFIASAAGCGSETDPATTGSGSTRSSSASEGSGAAGGESASSGSSSQGGGTSSATTGSGGEGGTGGGGAGGGEPGSGGAGGSGMGGSGMGGSGMGGSGMGGSGMGGSGMGGGGVGGDGTGGSGGSGGSQACQTSSDCDDGAFCNGAETCDSGFCKAGAAPACSDGIGCTLDFCDPMMDACSSTINDAACDDGMFCDGLELCDPAFGDPVTGCTESAGSPCDDGVSCTADACDEAADSCAHTADNAACDNNVTCDGAEVCNALFGCMSSGPLSCDDGIACTSDFCDLTADACIHVNEDLKCQNGVFCDGIEKCDPVNGASQTGCAAGAPLDCNDGIACTGDSCNESMDVCEHATNDAACDDGVFCNGAEACVTGAGCQASAPVGCDDGLSCTADACSEAQKTCVFTPNDAACSDGLDCNGVETCDPAGAGPTGCASGAPIPCVADAVACTVDACNETTNTCEHAASNALCPAGQFCVPGQGNGCTPALPCSSNAQCDDGDACNGVETCDVVCQTGQPVTCDDGVACTTDACDPGTGACSHAVNDDFCGDGLACNGVELCDPAAGCMAGAPILCDDGLACSYNECQEPSGTCVFTKSSSLCSDGQFCNGVEVCTDAGCAPGQPVVCPDDGIACTTAVCDPALNTCKQIAQDNLCACGETCDPAQGGCGSFCTVSQCQGKTYACGDCVDNDGDCKIDSSDEQCLGPCDNTESSFYGGIAGQNNSPCKSDCYFDQDTGSGNDDCFWSHKCDPLEVAPNYPPEGSQCAYNPNASIPGYNGTCSSAFTAQSATCGSYCGPLTPNGCDCFGCCAIPGAPTTVWLGSENPSGTGSCNINTLNDPTKCKPCTQVTACLNTCENCEVCIGKPELPPECSQQECKPGVQTCGLVGQPPCLFGHTCITGCCILNP